jgi:uncharacterized protein YegP (UPF0339 family)
MYEIHKEGDKYWGILASCGKPSIKLLKTRESKARARVKKDIERIKSASPDGRYRMETYTDGMLFGYRIVGPNEEVIAESINRYLRKGEALTAIHTASKSIPSEISNEKRTHLSRKSNTQGV